MTSKLIFRLLLIFNFFSTGVLAQDYNPICWQGPDFLSFEDFQGSAISDSLSKANGWIKPAGLTSSTFRKHQVDYDSINIYRFVAYFECKLSWLDRDGALLKHEQTHFNILELVLRKHNMYLDSLSNSTGETVDYVLMQAMIEEEWDELNEQFDKKTNHGAISIINREWYDSIKTEIQSLKDYRFLCN